MRVVGARDAGFRAWVGARDRALVPEIECMHAGGARDHVLVPETVCVRAGGARDAGVKAWVGARDPE
ncbi:MAG: hypothetical protein LBC46_05305 [Treponema sp.]|nr:hypothetical protein [Treponema sp.]